MFVLHDFLCKNGHITEIRHDNSIRTMDCPVCSELAEIMPGISNIKLDGTDPGFPGAWSKWADIRERRHRENK